MLTLDSFSFCCSSYSARSQFSTSDNLTGRKNHARLLWYAYYRDLLSFSINRRPWCNNISPSQTIQDGAPLKHYQLAFQLRQTFSILDNTKLTGITLINPAHLYLAHEQTRPFSWSRFHINPHTDASEAACAALGPRRIFASKPHSWPVLQHSLHDTFSNPSNISPDVFHNEKSKTAIREGRYPSSNSKNALARISGLWLSCAGWESLPRISLVPRFISSHEEGRLSFVSFFTAFVSFNRSTLFHGISWISLACFHIYYPNTNFLHISPLDKIKVLLRGFFFFLSLRGRKKTSARATSPRNAVNPSLVRPFLCSLFRMYDPSVVWAILFQHAYFSFIEH